MASAKQIAWRKKFARMSKAGVFRKTTKKEKKRLDEKHEYLGNIRRVREADEKYAKSLKKSNSKKNGGRFIHYNYETKAKANQSRKEFQQAGEKIKPPYQRKMKVPHHGNNYYYWTIARPVTW